MTRAVRFSHYGGPDVLQIVEVPDPVPGPGEVLVGVVAVGLNPVEAAIREGRFDAEWPAHFPAGQGSDFAGIVRQLGTGVTGWKVDDEVMGHVVRGSQAELISVVATDIVRKPASLAWEVAGSLYVAGANAWRAVQDVNPHPGRTVLVHAAAGGVGGIAAQLARLRGATVIGTASPESFDRLRQLGVVPVEYGPGLAERLAGLAPNGIDAELDHLGDDSLANLRSADTTDSVLLAKIARMVADRQIVVPVAAIYPFVQVQDAYRELEAGHAHGKIVLSLHPVGYLRQKVRGIDMRESEATRDAPGRVAGPPAHEVLPPVFGHPRRHPTDSAAEFTLLPPR